MELIIYSVIVTYKDYQEDLDNVFPTKESAIAHAKKIANSNDVYKVVVQRDIVTEEYGRGWLATVFEETHE